MYLGGSPRLVEVERVSRVEEYGPVQVGMVQQVPRGVVPVLSVPHGQEVLLVVEPAEEDGKLVRERRLCEGLGEGTSLMEV